MVDFANFSSGGPPMAVCITRCRGRGIPFSRKRRTRAYPLTSEDHRLFVGFWHPAEAGQVWVFYCCQLLVNLSKALLEMLVWNNNRPQIFSRLLSFEISISNWWGQQIDFTSRPRAWMEIGRHDQQEWLIHLPVTLGSCLRRVWRWCFLGQMLAEIATGSIKLLAPPLVGREETECW